MGLPIIQSTLRNLAAEHFFQTYGLGAELEFVRLVGFWAAALILHGIGEPEAFLSPKRDSLRRHTEFYHITLSGQPETIRHHG